MMDFEGYPTLGVVGLGKVGETLARLYSEKGYTVGAVYSRRRDHCERIATSVGAIPVASPADVIGNADLTLITVPDRVIRSVSKAAAEWSGDLAGKAVVHTSGAQNMAALEACRERGAVVGSLHPAYPFADVETAMVGLPGATFAVEAEDERLLAWLSAMVQALDGQVLHISPDAKPLYHAALVFASNYTVTLYALAENLLVDLGADRRTADNALDRLVAGTVENIKDIGVPWALTGPFVRQDTETIALHLDALAKVSPRLADLYRELALNTYPLLQARGVTTSVFEALLRGDKENDPADSP